MESGSTPSPKKVKGWYKQPFNEEWLNIADFKLWLEREPEDKYSARCTVCSKTLAGVNKSALMKHADTTKHIKNYEAIQGTPYWAHRQSALLASSEEFSDLTNWTKDRLELLVSLYANEELLWNTALPDYHHKRPRKEAYNRIAVAMELPLEAIVRKIRYIRTYYTRELLRMRRNSTGTPFKSTWPLYNMIDSFLRDHIQYQKPAKVKDGAESSGSELNEDIDDTEDLQTEDVELMMGQPMVIRTNHPESPLEASSSRPKRLRNDSQNKSAKKRKLQPGSTGRLTGAASGHSTEDPDTVFGRHVANELRLIKDLKSKQFAKLQIHNILFNAQFGFSSFPNEINIPMQLTL